VHTFRRRNCGSVRFVLLGEPFHGAGGTHISAVTYIRVKEKAVRPDLMRAWKEPVPETRVLDDRVIEGDASPRVYR
jgi:hypothetical protein